MSQPTNEPDGWELAARIFERPGAYNWATTATSLEQIIEQIDAKEIQASRQGRAFLAGAVTALHAVAMAEARKPEPDAE
ncbi:hypothetical protein [Crystallibacter degradans]|uniref:hypothetical protein n=1 Tax=Crystallibacter degradans TaxID=2726743 RepID=UPI001475E733|nr:hypothetical protein [Arthrobacter sp. SF27]NMR29945.1 hypothetical protein [Arthrobacter sp. SF27]